MSALAPLDERDVRRDGLKWRWALRGRGSSVLTLAACALALLLQADPAAAQADPAAAQVGSAPAQGELWRLSLTAAVNYSNNVRLRTTSSQTQPRGLVGTLGAGVAHTFVGADSSLNVGFHAGAMFFQNLKELNRVTTGTNVGYTRPLSNSTSLNVSEQYTSNYTTRLDDLATEGVILPLVGARRNDAMLDLDHDISERSAMNVSIRHDLFFFRGDPDLDPDVIDGWRLGAGLRFSRQFSAGQSGSASFGYSRYGRSTNSSDNYSAGIGWSQVLGPRLRVGANIGASMARSDAFSAPRATGSASVSWQLWQGSLHASFNRSMGLGLGLGRVTVREGLAFGFDQTLWRKLSLSITGRQVSHSDPFDSLFKYDAQSATVSVKMKLFGSTGVGTSYTYLKRAGRDPTSGFRGGLQFSYHKDF